MAYRFFFSKRKLDVEFTEILFFEKKSRAPEMIEFPVEIPCFKEIVLVFNECFPITYFRKSKNKIGGDAISNDGTQSYHGNTIFYTFVAGSSIHHVGITAKLATPQYTTCS